MSESRTLIGAHHKPRVLRRHPWRLCPQWAEILKVPRCDRRSRRLTPHLYRADDVNSNPSPTTIERFTSWIPTTSHCEPIEPRNESHGNLVLAPHTGYALAAISLTRCDDGVYEVAASLTGRSGKRDTVARSWRPSVPWPVSTSASFNCELASSRTLASLRWLASCGFVGYDAPRRHILPNGREVESLWWHRTDRFGQTPVP
jgi:hypothetical protein